MKRFFCSRCQRIVRARSLPRDARKSDAGATIQMIGTCKQHVKFETHRPGWGRTAVDGRRQ